MPDTPTPMEKAMQFEIKKRWSWMPSLTVEIDARFESESLGVQLGAAVKVAFASGADLSGADLSGAVLRGADLSRADLSDAVLSRADLSGADLNSFKADYWMILTQNRAEVPGLVAALKDGKVDGSTYTGDCACLVGTIANVRQVDVETLEKNSTRPAEQWFLMIRKGDKPGDDSGGGFAAKMALEWAEEWAAASGVDL